MTNFTYENEWRIKELSKKYFEERRIEKEIIDSVEKLDVYKYILAYRILAGEKIAPNVLEMLRNKAQYLKHSKESKIFFEKVEDRRDLIYFEDYMRKLEKEPYFLATWRTWFRKSA